MNKIIYLLLFFNIVFLHAYNSQEVDSLKHESLLQKIIKQDFKIDTNRNIALIFISPKLCPGCFVLQIKNLINDLKKSDVEDNTVLIFDNIDKEELPIYSKKYNYKKTIADESSSFIREYVECPHFFGQ